MKRMRNFYDIDSGISYLEIRSRVRHETKKENTLGMGLTIVIGFMCSVILMFAMA